MIEIPTHVNARWIATLGDEQLVAAESQSFSAYCVREIAEKNRAGSRYMLLQGPSALVNAWQQWQLLNSEARARGVIVRRK